MALIEVCDMWPNFTDIIFEEYLPPKRTSSENRNSLSLKPSLNLGSDFKCKENSNTHDEVPDGISNHHDCPQAEILQSESRDKLTSLPARKETSEMTAHDFSNFNDFSFDDSKKKGYLSSLKKKLTFSRPPKNADTDTFLNELSAQFDEEMHLVDDLQIDEEDEANKIKYGEKWSYTPSQETTNETQETNPSQKSNQEELSGLPTSLPPPEESVAPSPLPEQQPSEETATVDRQRVRRRRRRVQNNDVKPRAETTMSVYQPDIVIEPVKRISDPLIEQRLMASQTPKEEEVVYDVPKPVTTQRRAHINVERRRRTRASRNAATASKRNSTELRMHVWMQNENQLVPELNSITESVKLRSHSPTEQTSFLDRAKVIVICLINNRFVT